MAGTISTRHEPGQRVSSLPSGYRSEQIQSSTFYYHQGNFYRARGDGYIVVAPPEKSRYYEEYLGYRTDGGDDAPRYISRLPGGYRTHNYNGERIFVHQDQYYRRHGQGYTLIAKPF